MKIRNVVTLRLTERYYHYNSLNNYRSIYFKIILIYSNYLNLIILMKLISEAIKQTIYIQSKLSLQPLS